MTTETVKMFITNCKTDLVLRKDREEYLRELSEVIKAVFTKEEIEEFIKLLTHR